MKIVHINLAMGYTEGLSYQENCESRCHARQGHQVWVITTPYCFNENGEWGPCTTSSDYINADGVHVIRLPFLYPLPYKINKQIGVFKGTKELLEEIAPDVICVHNLQFQDLRVIANYKKRHKEVRVYVDNHADFSNSARTWVSKNLLYRFWWKPCAKSIEPYAEAFYGVMPSRMDFMKNIYGIDEKKISLLVMGAEDDAVVEARSEDTRNTNRNKYHINKDDFLIVTGGKIDRFKTQTLTLMKAVAALHNSHVKLLVFGSVEPQLEKEFNQLCDGKIVQAAGWIKGNESYNLFAAADLVVFPGRHSVYWEQVAGLGIPMICKYWQGTTHVDVGGNVIFLKDDNFETMISTLREVIDHPVEYEKMKTVAEREGMKYFSYNEISKRAIGER